MTLAAASAAAPRPPGSKYGGHSGCSGTAHCYGEPGDHCECGQPLSRYNPRDRCNLCGGGKKRPRRSGASTSAAGTAGTNAAPAPRHNLGEEIEMAAEQRRHYGVCKELIAEFMIDGGWHGGAEVCQGVSCASSTATYHLQTGAECGQYETRPAPKGGFQYRLRRDAAARAAQMADYDDVQYPENAPVGPAGAAPVTEGITPEPPAGAPANEAPAPSPETLQAPVPFAGIVTTTLVGYSMSRELQILDGLEGLDDAARERVLQYAVDRWWLK